MSFASNLVGAFIRSPVSKPARVVARRIRETLYTAHTLGRIERKSAPLKTVTAPSEPVRVNLLIPEINFSSFYGGYMAKFHLALRLARRGAKVRVVIVDQCEVKESHWRDCVKAYAGLEDVFDHIEVSYNFDRSKELRCNPADAVIATTWWTAHIAGAMIEELERDQFIYMIQEYEPFTFAMGSWYAVADASYDLPHTALFSSALLRDYFRREQFGVFAQESAVDGEADSFAFENAIVAFSEQEVGASVARRDVPRKLLFYARPEAHATRNMFEIGYAALAKAVDQGHFKAGEWELHGIGSRHGDINLPAGQRLKMIGKVGLDAYRETLLQYDLGLSLMYTPHPSLLPLEMAAAGMRVVTTECLNKKAAEMAAISSNIVAARPTIDAVADALIKSAAEAADSDTRKHGASVNWSSSWDRTFNDATLERIEAWIRR